MLNYSDVNIVLDNQALNRICQEKLEIPDANYSDLNELIAHYFSSITSSMRFGGTINQSLNSIHSDMIPYPRVHFLMGTIASINTAEKAPFLNIPITEMVDAAFSSSSLLASIDTRLDRCLSSNIIF